MEIVIGYNFDYLLIDGVEKLIQEHKISKVNISFYIGSNQPNLSLGRSDSLDLGDEKTHISYIIQQGYQVTYALNGLYIELNTQIIDYVRDLIELGVDSFTISNFQLIDYLSEAIPDIKINISTVSRIYCLEQIMLLNLKNISKIILSHSVNQDIIEISKISHYLSLNYPKISLELVANELGVCDSQCYPCNVYDSFSKDGNGGLGSLKFGKTGCCSSEVSFKYLRNLGYCIFIRPNDIKLYSQRGIRSLKLATRKGINTERLLKIVQAYMVEDFSGNLILLMGDQGGKFQDLQIINTQLSSGFDQEKQVLLLDLGYEGERLEFIDFFSKHKFSNNTKAYIEYRIDSNNYYSGYVASNFSSSNTKDIILRNSQIIYFLDKHQKKISLNWRQLLMEFTKIICPLVISYGGFGKGYGIYIQNTELVQKLLKEFGFSQKIEPNITFIGFRLDNSGMIKLYERKLVEDGYVLSDKFTENILCTGIMTELDSDSKIVRTKTYLRYPGVHIKSDYFTDISDKFTSLNDFNFLDRIHINYISYEGEDLNKSSVYFVDDFNHKIANK